MFGDIRLEDLFEKSDTTMETWELKIAKSSAKFRDCFSSDFTVVHTQNVINISAKFDEKRKKTNVEK